MNNHIRRPNISASNMFRRDGCKASAMMEAKALETDGEQETSTDAATGVLIHAVMAGTEPEVNLTSDRDRWCVKFMREAQEEIVEQIFKEGAKLRIQKEVEYRWPDRPLEYAGRADTVIRDYEAKVAVIFDYKTGSNWVTNAEANLQGMTYITAERELKKFDQIWFVILQPFADSEEYRVQKVCYQQEDFEAATRRILAIRDAAEVGQELTPSVDNCRYCSAAAHCAAHHKLVAELAEKFINFNELEPAKQAEYARGLKLLEGIWNKSVKPALKEILAAKPDSVPGWALRPGSSLFDVTDPQAALDVLYPMLADDATEATAKFMAAVKVSVGALEEAAIDAMKKRGKVVTAVNEAGERTEQPPMAQAKLKEMIREMLLEAGAAKKSQKEPLLVEVRQ